MSVRNRIVLFLALSTLIILVGCGSSNSTPIAVAPPSGGFSNSNLSGTYVFSVSGYDFNGAPLAIVGTILANGSGGNGKGGITGGTIDIIDAEFNPAPGLTVNGNGFYSVGADGRGQFTIGTSAANPFGSNLTFDFVLSSSSHGLITEFDNNGSGSGTLDLQATGLTQASLAGPYAFSFAGVDGNGNPLATVGAFTLDSNGNVTTGDEDLNDAGLAYGVEVPGGSVTLGPSSTPATVVTSALGTLTYDVYAIDATHLKFIETDEIQFLSGDAYSQPSTTISGTMAFTLSGDFAGNSAAAGGFMVTDGAGNITIASTEDVNNGGAATSAPLAFSATYAAGGTGRYTLNNFSGFFGGTEYAAYPSSGGLLLLEIDDEGLMIGGAYPETSTSFATAQGYALNLSGFNIGNAIPVDDIAEFTAATSACDKAGDILCGIIDETYPGANPPYFDQALLGSYGPLTTAGRNGVGATAGSTASPGTLNGGFDLTLYSVDGTNFPFIESDNGQVAVGVAIAQNAGDPPSAGVVASHMFVPRSPAHPRNVRMKKE
jgi:hypothetical protein